MKRKIVVCIVWIFLASVALAANATAQTVAYRQTNLVSNNSEFGPNVDPDLVNSWGIAFLPGQPFFITNNKSGIVTALNAAGLNTGLPSFQVPNEMGPGSNSPTGIVADPNGFFGGRDLPMPLIVVVQEGLIYISGANAMGQVLPQATAEFLNASAVYTGATILAPACCAPFLAVADFKGGLVESHTTGFALLSPPGTFSDPNLPAGYAPFGMQLIGNQLFITYAVQDAAKQNPVPGAGNGLVDIFDLEGNFVKRFATGGTLNAPWGVTQASANFGPFSNDILIGNVGDGTINAFDPNTGNFLGQIKDGNGSVIIDLPIHGLAFRSDGFGDPNTLYFASGIGGFGLFGTITTGLVSTTQVSGQPGTNGAGTFTATVTPGPVNTGTPTGTVNFSVDGNAPQTVPLTGGTAQFTATLTGQGEHIIRAIYSGDATFLTSRAEEQVVLNPVPTTVMLTAPANAAPGAAVTLTAHVTGQGGTPSGQVTFQEGSTNLGNANLDATGAASVTISTLAVGTHNVTATYAGDDTFGGSTSTAVTINIANADFALAAAPPSATVTAGQSTQFMLTVTPSGGFANNVTFSCSVVTGISCSFNPATVTPSNGAASTTMTVNTSATVPQIGMLRMAQIGPVFLLLGGSLLGLVIACRVKLQMPRFRLVAVGAMLAVFTASFVFAGCGGGSSNGMQPNRETATIMVTAQSGTLTHTTTVNVTVQ